MSSSLHTTKKKKRETNTPTEKEIVCLLCSVCKILTQALLHLQACDLRTCRGSRQTQTPRTFEAVRNKFFTRCLNIVEISSSFKKLKNLSYFSFFFSFLFFFFFSQLTENHQSWQHTARHP